MDAQHRPPIPLPRKSKQRPVEDDSETLSNVQNNVIADCLPKTEEVDGKQAPLESHSFNSNSHVYLDDTSSVLSFTSDSDVSDNGRRDSIEDGRDGQNTSRLSTSLPLIPSRANVCFVGWLRARRRKSKVASLIWAVLKENALQFYRDDSCERLLDALPCSNVLMVSVCDSTPDTGLTLFYVHPKHRKVKCRFLSTDSPQDSTAWTTLIGKSFLNNEIADLDGVLDAVGRAYVKQGSTSAWTAASLAKVGYSLFYSTMSSDCVYELDFRKVFSLKTKADKHECCSVVKEKGNCFVVMMENSTLWLQADTKEVSAAWKNVFDCVLKKRSSLLCEQRLTSDDVPVIVDKCVNFISIYGLKTEGIHRLSGACSKVDELYAAFVSNPFTVHLLPENHSVHTVASVLRKFLAQLAEPLVPTDVTLRLMGSVADVRANGTALVDWYKLAMKQLPPVNQATLRKLLKHLMEVTLYSELNKMNIRNVACIFAPTIFRLSSRQDEAETTANGERVNLETGIQIFSIVADLIQNYADVFDVSAEESYRDSLLHRALSKLDTTVSVPMKLSSGFLHCLHVMEKDKMSFNVKIGVDSTADDVCDYVKGRDIPSLPSNIALYEVICDGQLERIVASDESVFDILMRWISWPQNDRIGNYIIVKEDVWTDRAVQCAVQTPTTRWMSAYVSLSKSFVKQSMILMPNELLLFKNQKEEMAEQIWRLGDYLWFVGAESKRHAPARFNVTFIRNCEFLIRSKPFPYLGVTLSFKQESDLLRLLAKVLQTESVGLK